MTDFHGSPGRAAELIVGAIVLVLALLFLLGFVVLLVKGKFAYPQLAVGAALAGCVCWFGQLGIRLLFNKQRKEGGLLSAGELRFWCEFFGVVGVIECGVAIYQGSLALLFAGAVMVIACLYGLRIASARAARKNKS